MIRFISESVEAEIAKDIIDAKSRGKQSLQSRHVMKRPEVCLKLVALVIGLSSVAFHLHRVFTTSADTCTLLFDSGLWNSNGKWQPYGCIVHNYIPSEMRTCLRNNKVAFVGDSRMRELYFRLTDSLSANKLPTGKFHSNLQYTEPSNVSVAFYWYPEADNSMDKLFASWLKNYREAPDLVLAGAGTWTIKNRNIKAVLEYQEHLTKLKGTLSRLVEARTKLLQNSSRHRRLHVSRQVIWVLQDPVVESKLHKSRQMLTNEKIELFNVAAAKVLQNSDVRILSATTMVAAGRPVSTQDGLHYNSDVTDTQLNIILNAFCNRYMVPNDASCCTDAEKITNLQFNTFAILATCSLLWFIMFCVKRWKMRQLGQDSLQEVSDEGFAGWIHSEELYPVMKALAKLAFIMLYFFLSDRTNVFMKENKQMKVVNFSIPLVLCLLIGILGTRKVKQSFVLNNEQTDEWQGWMMAFILIYNYTAAGEVLPINVHYRLVVSSYMFLVGYKGFAFFWEEGDFGLYRVCQFMARLNVFTVALCLVMGRPYQFYYIVPLASFWLLMIYFSMAAVPRITEKIAQETPRKYTYVAIKFGIMFGLIFIVWGNETVCSWLFSHWAIKELFVDETGSINAWLFHSRLDRYSILFGMVFGLSYYVGRAYSVVREDMKNRFLFAPIGTVAAIILGVAFIVGYEIQAFTCHTETSCNYTHAVASCIPITGYVLLRNVATLLRTRYSCTFAWIGRISTELFVAQYHIWLAKDSHGLLVIIPNYPELNAILLTFVFICVVHEVSTISDVLSKALVTKDVRIMLRRLLIFIVALIVIWWHKTHQAKPLPS